METERRRQLLLAALAVVLAIVVYRTWPRTAAPTAPASNGRGRPAAGAPPAPGGAPAVPGGTAQDTQSGAPDVHLEALSAPRPKPNGPDRNLFRFKPKAPPPPPSERPAPVAPPVPTGPPLPAPPPPINLKFIGIIDQGGDKPKIAVLTDNTGGPPFYGREGETVAGRYRILKIGVESIEMAYLDGRGRQTIRLTGS